MNTEELAGLRQRFEKFWAEIRGSRLYAGQPRNAQSAAGVSLAREALRLATEAEDDDLLLEARKMMYYSLTADEQYSEAIPYSEQAIAQCEQRGQYGQAARVRIGQIEALSHAGRYSGPTINTWPPPQFSRRPETVQPLRRFIRISVTRFLSSAVSRKPTLCTSGPSK